MKAQFTQETYIEAAKKKHGNKYDYSKVNYINIVEKITISCPLHGEFNQPPGNHLHGFGCTQCGLDQASKNRAKNCGKKFISRARKIHGDQYDYSKVEYKKAIEEIEIICSVHGSFFQSPNQHLGGRGCRLCGINRRAKKRTTTFLEFCQKAEKIHNNKYSYLKKSYKGASNDVHIICPEHGEFTQLGLRHLKGNGCFECGEISRAKTSTKTTEEFIFQAKEVHSDKFDYSRVNYVKGRVKVEIICPNHGSFLQTPEGHLSGRGCKECTYFVSKKETEWLDSLGLPKDGLHRNVTLKVNDKIVRVDGYCAEENTIYEFYGDYWHGNPETKDPDEINERTEETFGELYEKTMKRESLLKKAGFKLVTIWENNY